MSARDILAVDLARRGVSLRLKPDALDKFGAWETVTEASRRAVGVSITRPTERPIVTVEDDDTSDVDLWIALLLRPLRKCHVVEAEHIEVYEEEVA